MTTQDEPIHGESRPVTERAYEPPVDAHVGGWSFKNAAEMEWECDDNCPHPDHDHEEGR